MLGDAATLRMVDCSACRGGKLSYSLSPGSGTRPGMQAGLSSLHIRRFRKGDGHQCAVMLTASFAWYFRLKDSEWLRNKFSAASISSEAKRGISLVAIDAGRVIGYCHASISDYGAAYISTVGVSPDERKRGAGAMLLKELEEICRKNGVRKIWLMVTHVNREAISFYRRHGYRKEGMIRDLTTEGAHEIIMSRHL